MLPFKGERDSREGGEEGVGEMRVYLYSHRGVEFGALTVDI